MNAILVWKPEWETGSSLIDRQHQGMLEHVNHVLQAVAQGKGPEQVAKTLQFLSFYVEAHFGMEEALMERSAFPGIDDHRLIHKSLRWQVRDLVERMAADPEAVFAILPAFLSDWLTMHIDQQDRDLARHLRETGQAGS